MTIARRLRELRDNVEIRFVSYGSGADTFNRAGEPHIDLEFPDRNPILDTLVLAGKLIHWLNPDLVVAHEEFIALPASKIFDKPAVLLTDWFTHPAKPTMSTIPFADRILFLDQPGLFDEPEAAKGKIEYVGPVVRDFRYTREDRLPARAKLQVSPDAFLVVVLPGSSREEFSPAVELVLAAFDELPSERKQMIWIAGADHEQIACFMGDRLNVVVQEYDPDIDRLMVAADVAITKGTSTTMRELASLGVPSVSLHNYANSIDNVRAPGFPDNVVVPKSATAKEVASLIMHAVERRPPPGKDIAAGGMACARSILRLLSTSGKPN